MSLAKAAAVAERQLDHAHTQPLAGLQRAALDGMVRSLGSSRPAAHARPRDDDMQGFASCDFAQQACMRWSTCPKGRTTSSPPASTSRLLLCRLSSGLAGLSGASSA